MHLLDGSVLAVVAVACGAELVVVRSAVVRVGVGGGVAGLTASAVVGVHVVIGGVACAVEGWKVCGLHGVWWLNDVDDLCIAHHPPHQAHNRPRSEAGRYRDGLLGNVTHHVVHPCCWTPDSQHGIRLVNTSTLLSSHDLCNYQINGSLKGSEDMEIQLAARQLSSRPHTIFCNKRMDP
jgi:hypothetical protein